ncbi:undecaprenyl-diphosphate phosphatase [Candidatus Saccharibacteria bacterium]|jgi:undecaprenyl-diphosphatase|nr:undecaprenyl-diphosphate phosphatase [Candidatus Saccharibacteria bacterium]
MQLFEVIILGLIQGLTEFIPISSSGHLVIAQWLFGHTSDHLFLEVINIGTFLALLVYFAPKIWNITRDVVVNKKVILARNILITAVPAGVVGYLLSDFINTTPFFGSIWVVVATLFVVGVIMVVLEKLPRLSNVTDGESLGASRALTIGLAQMLALIPGVSRSGSTIITGRLMGLRAKEAAEYSFLASLPIMAGVTLKVFIDNPDYMRAHLSTVLVGNLVAFVSGLIAVGFLMRYLSRHGLAVFGWYRIVLATIIFVVLLVQ